MEKSPSNVMHCAVWYYLCNIKNVKNTHGGVLILLKLTLPHGYFPRFLNCTNSTKSRNTPSTKAPAFTKSMNYIGVAGTSNQLFITGPQTPTKFSKKNKVVCGKGFVPCDRSISCSPLYLS